MSIHIYTDMLSEALESINTESTEEKTMISLE